MKWTGAWADARGLLAPGLGRSTERGGGGKMDA